MLWMILFPSMYLLVFLVIVSIDTYVLSLINAIITFIESVDPDVKITAAETLALLTESVKSIEGEVGDTTASVEGN